MTNVIKRSGKKQRFSTAKLKKAIFKAAKDAKLKSIKIRILLKDIAGSIIRKVKLRKLIKAVDLRKAILKRLDRKARKVAQAWRRYDKSRKKN